MLKLQYARGPNSVNLTADHQPYGVAPHANHTASRPTNINCLLGLLRHRIEAADAGLWKP